MYNMHTYICINRDQHRVVAVTTNNVGSRFHVSRFDERETSFRTTGVMRMCIP